MEKFNKKIVVTISLLVLTTLLSSCFKDNEYVQKVPAKENPIVVEVANSDENMKNTETASNSVKGTYAEYSESALSQAKGDIVLFFHADWCGTCTATKNDIIEKGAPEGLTILEANFDKDLDLRKKYGVTVQTTFVQVDSKGDMIKKWSGSKDLSNIIENVEKTTTTSTTKNESVLKGTYTKYSASTVSEAKGDIVLFFHADWCPTCVATEKDIIAKGVPAGLTILNTSFDNELELRKKYGVVAQTTFVQIDNKGNLIKKWSGGKLADIIEKVGE